MSVRSPLDYDEEGITRLFGQHDLHSDGLVSGWSSPEQGHVWNDGFDAILELLTAVPSGPYLLTFEGEPFLNESCRRQDVTFYVNGYRLGFWRLTEARNYILSAVIEPENLLGRGTKSFARCVWHLLESVRPTDGGLGADTRLLGFCFRSFALLPHTHR